MEMYYCVECSKLHNVSGVEGEIFENGFYINPFLVKKIHLGMCGGINNIGSNKRKITETTIPSGLLKLERMIDENLSIMINEK
jgi:hypothetical protein